VTDARAVLDAAMTEADWQDQVMDA